MKRNQPSCYFPISLECFSCFFAAAAVGCIMIYVQEGRPDQRNMNDSAALGAKVAAKQAAKKAQEETDKLAAEWGAGTAGAPKVLPKKKKAVKKGDGMDDLLSAGLSASKKKGK
jgi:acyl-coenzyme A synthetase/AMP-(fatty) acid ligase